HPKSLPSHPSDYRRTCNHLPLVRLQMSTQKKNRRHFLRSALLGTAAAGSVMALPTVAQASSSAAIASKATAPTAGPASPAYIFLTPSEASFIEALVDHMVPADKYSPKGSDLHI